MSDKIQESYRQTRNIYDDVLTRSKWWSRLYMDVFWGGIDDNEIAATVRIPRLEDAKTRRWLPLSS